MLCQSLLDQLELEEPYPWTAVCPLLVRISQSRPSIAEFNSTVQVKITSDPIVIWLELAALLLRVINDGVGTIHETTVCQYSKINNDAWL